MDHFGGPILDLLGSVANRQVWRFFSRYYHRMVESTNALMSPWPWGLLCAFPPFPLIARLVRRIWLLHVGVAVVAVHLWFSDLQDLSITQPVSLPVSPGML